MIKPIIWLISLIGSTSLFGQELINTAGQTMTSEFLSLDWSLGEGYISNYPTPTASVSEGFLALNLEDQVYTLTHDLVQLSSIEIYPNPASEKISFTQLSASGTLKDIHIIDLSGYIKYYQSFYSHSVEVADLPSGLYYILFRYQDHTGSIGKFIKE
jgi:hypothetical protein